MFLATLGSLYSRFRSASLAAQTPSEAQERLLLGLVNRAKDTVFGRQHSFAKIKSVAEYQTQVPLRRYEQFWKEYLEFSFPRLDNILWPGLIPFYSLSSGTSSGTTKYIPCSHQMLKSMRLAALDILAFHLANHPGSDVLGGRSFVLGGSTELRVEAPGVLSGDLSGITAATVPWWAKGAYFPPPNLALLKDWNEKIDILARRSLNEDIRMISGVPSWLLIFFERAADIAGLDSIDLDKLYPRLRLLVHGGVSFAPYRDRFNALRGSSQAEFREVYPASEGFLAIGDRRERDEGLRLLLDRGVFFEFIPVDELSSNNPTRHWIANIEPNVQYAVVLSTCAGLWSYILGDTVRFTDNHPPRLIVSGRTSYFLSAFGEHLIGEEIEDAVTSACSQQGLQLVDFAVGAYFPRVNGELGRHIFFIEGDRMLNANYTALARELSAIIDARLSTRNEDYEAHRRDNTGMDAPEIRLVKAGAFAHWMESRGKLGGQNKVPRVINNHELFVDLEGKMAEWLVASSLS